MTNRSKRAISYIIVGILFVLAVVLGGKVYTAWMMLLSAVLFIVMGVALLIQGTIENRNKK